MSVFRPIQGISGVIGLFADKLIESFLFRLDILHSLVRFLGEGSRKSDLIFLLFLFFIGLWGATN